MNCWLKPWLYRYISALWFYLLLYLKVLCSGRWGRGKAAKWTVGSNPGSTATFLPYDFIYFFTWRSCALEGLGGGRQLNELLAQTLAQLLHFCLMILFTSLPEGPALWKVWERKGSWMNCWLRPWLYHYISAFWFYFFLNLKVLRSGRCERGKAAEWTASSDPGSTSTQEGTAGLPLLPCQVMGSPQGNLISFFFNPSIHSIVSLQSV